MTQQLQKREGKTRNKQKHIKYNRTLIITKKKRNKRKQKRSKRMMQIMGINLELRIMDGEEGLKPRKENFFFIEIL